MHAVVVVISNHDYAKEGWCMGSNAHALSLPFCQFTTFTVDNFRSAASTILSLNEQDSEDGHIELSCSY